ncbi:MAG: ABC transporter substrate-binding protein [Trueperaceae bacterium]
MYRPTLRQLSLIGLLLLLWAGTAFGQQYQEAPSLAELVEAGELPPVEERLPAEPAELFLLGEPGEYGGTAFVYAVAPDPWNDMMPAPEMSPRFLQMDMQGNLSASMLADWEVSDDYMTGTFTLREGMKWSDGQPVTMDDVRIVYEVMAQDPELTWWNLDYPRKGYEVGFEAIDEWAFRLTLNKPKPRWEEELAGNAGNMIMNILPSHYMGRYHPDLNPDAEELAASEGFDTWQDAFNDKYAPYDIDQKPTLHPWIVTELTSNRRVLERNPYFFGVDSEGRQLPYIDRIVAQIVDPETYSLNIVSGQNDLAYLYPTFKDFTLFKQNEAAGDYRVQLVPSLMASNLSLIFNLTHSDPVKRDLYGNVDFRRAVSVAINRDEVNDLLYIGQAVPGQTTAKPNAEWYQEEWAQSYAQHDPELANGLLDGLGMTDRDGEGFRRAPDGSEFATILTITDSIEGVGDPAQAAELLKEYLEDVGLRVEIRNVGGDLHNESLDAGTFDATIEGHSYLQEYESFAVLGDENYSWAGRGWFNWLRAQQQVESGERSLEDFEGGVLPGVEPPQWVKDHEETFQRARQVHPDSEEYAELMTRIFDNQAEQLVVIGVAGQLPDLFIASNSIHNVPEAYTPRQIWQGELGEFAYQFWIDQ